MIGTKNFGKKLIVLIQHCEKNFYQELIFDNQILLFIQRFNKRSVSTL